MKGQGPEMQRSCSGAQRAGAAGAAARSALYAAAVGMMALMLPVASAHADGNLAFDIEISLSTKAATKLKSTGEGITVLASYYGDPSAAGKKHVNEMGTVDITSETISVSGAPGKVHVSGREATAKRLGWVLSPEVNVNVFSSRKASDDNILNCDIIDNTVAKVIRASPVELHCSLIEEGGETQVKP